MKIKQDIFPKHLLIDNKELTDETEIAKLT